MPAVKAILMQKKRSRLAEDRRTTGATRFAGWSLAAILLVCTAFSTRAGAQTADESTPAAPADEPIPTVKRALPKVGETKAVDAPELVPDERPTAEEAVRGAFEPPPSARGLNKEASLWIDPKTKRVYVDGYVIMDRGALEMFACPMHTKEHESVVAVLAKSSQVHAALLAIGAMPGTPVRYSPQFLPATGQRIRVWVSWLDEAGEYHVADARTWIQNSETQKAMESDWVFAGSGFWKDEEDGKEYYKADSGDMICVSNFSTAMLDVPVASSAQADSLLYRPFTERIPKRGMPVRLTLVPIPVPTDDPNDKEKTDVDTPPSKDILTKKAAK